MLNCVELRVIRAQPQDLPKEVFIFLRWHLIERLAGEIWHAASVVTAETRLSAAILLHCPHHLALLLISQDDSCISRSHIHIPGKKDEKHMPAKCEDPQTCHLDTTTYIRKGSHDHPQLQESLKS